MTRKSSAGTLSPNPNFLLPTTCLEHRENRVQHLTQPDQKQLREMVQEMVQEMVGSIFISHEQQMLVQLRQSNSWLTEAVKDLEERMSDCEAKLLNAQHAVPSSDKSSVADGAATAEREDAAVESAAIDANGCEVTVAERDGLSQKVEDEQAIMPLQASETKRAAKNTPGTPSSVAASTPPLQRPSSSIELEYSSKELQLQGSGRTPKQGTASLATSGGAGYSKSESVYALQESVWDSAMLIGMPHMHWLGSCWIALLFLINVFMQGILCCLINDIFTIAEYDDGTIDDMVHWRLHSAHAWEFVDKQTYAPLAQRICRYDGSVPMSSGVARVLGAVAQYMPEYHEWAAQEPIPFGKMLQYSENVGMTMCLLSIVIWCLMVGEDMEEIWSLTKSLAFVPIASSTRVDRTDDGTYVWRTTTMLRRVWCFIIVFCKAFVAAFLAIDGTLYLCFTINLRELLLNCSALQIVLDLDDIIFQALAPTQASSMIAKMEPLARGLDVSYASLNPLPVIVLSIIVVNLIVLSATVLSQQMDILEKARVEICGGNIHFVVVQDTTGLIYATEVSKTQNDPLYPNAVMRELIWDPLAVDTGFRDGSLSAVATGMSGGQFSLSGITAIPIEAMSAIRNSRCLDLLSPGDQSVRAYNLILEEAIRRSVTSCESVKEHCSGDSPAGIRARQYCPETCGCSYLGSSLALVGDEQGCPLTCQETSRYRAVLSSRSCSDEVANSTMLRNYIEGLESYIAAAPEDWRPDIQIIVAQVTSKGCDVVTSWNSTGMRYPWDDLCLVSASWSLQSLAFACPRACKCNNLTSPICPPSCKESLR